MPLVVKLFNREKIVSQKLSVSDVTHDVSFDTTNQAQIFKESGELVRDVYVYYVLLIIKFSSNGFTL